MYCYRFGAKKSLRKVAATAIDARPSIKRRAFVFQSVRLDFGGAAIYRLWPCGQIPPEIYDWGKYAVTRCGLKVADISLLMGRNGSGVMTNIYGKKSIGAYLLDLLHLGASLVVCRRRFGPVWSRSCVPSLFRCCPFSLSRTWRTPFSVLERINH